MSVATIYTGDDVLLSCTLKKDDAVFAIDSGAEVKASIITTDRKKTIIGPVTQSSATPGADWDNSLVIVKFTSAESGAGTIYGPAILEVQVDDNGKDTWENDVLIVKGTIA